MSRTSTTDRLGALLGATVGAIALLAVTAGPMAAAGPGRAPLIDGSRPAAAARITVQAHTLYSATPARRTGQVRVEAQAARLEGNAARPAGGNPCTDRAWSPKRADRVFRWSGTYRWSFQAKSTPEGIGRRATEQALKRSVANITDARNDCGRADKVAATAVYEGRTNRRPGPTAGGSCAARDGVNVIGFGRLPSGIAGLTCVWSIGSQIIEADIKLDRDAAWAVSLASCTFASMVEAVATHEFGHVFGLGHVSETRHGRLTMSERLDGYCQLNEATLGLGDMLGLEARY